jgi:C1A family cysteine protease
MGRWQFLKTLCVILVFLIAFPLPATVLAIDNNIPQLAPLNPDFVRYQQNALKPFAAGADDTTDQNLGAIPSPVLITNDIPIAKSGAFPAKYDLRSQNRLTPIRNQGQLIFVGLLPHIPLWNPI